MHGVYYHQVDSEVVCPKCHPSKPVVEVIGCIRVDPVFSKHNEPIPVTEQVEFEQFLFDIRVYCTSSRFKFQWSLVYWLIEITLLAWWS